MATVFFSWQSDTPSRVGRQFLEDALTTALKEIMDEDQLELVEADRGEDLVLDRDTKGVAGSPAIVETILKKIDVARAFVADLTYVGTRENGEKMPNANVLIEYGWAFKSLTDSRLIGVMNSAYGYPPEDPLPFDLRHRRNPIRYDLPETAAPAVRDRVKAGLVKDLKKALLPILKLGSTDTAIVVPPFVPREAADGRGRFRAKGERIGVEVDELASSLRNVDLDAGPTLWIRLWPRHPGPARTPVAIRSAMQASQRKLSTLFEYQSIGLVRGDDGLGVYAYMRDGAPTPSVAYVFETGEVWISHVNDLIEKGVLYFHEKELFNCFERAVAFMRVDLSLEPPFHWEAGIEGLKDLKIHPSAPGYPMRGRAVGQSLKDQVVMRGVTSIPEQPANLELKAFVEAVYAAFGVSAPEWLFR